MKSLLTTPHAAMLENAISTASLRHKVTANNVANVNTPNFKRSEVPFEDVLREESDRLTKKLSMTVTHERHMAKSTQTETISSQIHQVSENSSRTDGNNVDIEIEMATMAKNTIYYDASVQQLSRYFSTLKSAIKEGRS